MKWLETRSTQLVFTAVLSASAGIAAGYFASAQILEKKFRKIADDEIAEAKVFYQGMYSRPVLEAEVAPDDDAVQAVIKEAVQEVTIDRVAQALEGYSPTPSAEEAAEERNIFTTHVAPSEQVLDALLAERDENVPFLITKEEYFQNDPDNEQRTFTYYEGGRTAVLVDDAEEFDPIEDIDKVAGEDNLLHFGYGSGDEYTVYIRNNQADPPFDLCVTKSTGDYAQEVMGFDDQGPHLAHTQKRRRWDDE